ncbi:cobalt-precorrin-6A reductase [Consotaella salsifontis]|uniref:Precorrin-6A reductase n=1 Tax=Consotaella salsifontis TaxID=1365950 RepID=A0A1T4SIU6_9HYPH|nr:cobalt-precorrin-6A reductase [Consotaella salsifontis]SKA28244.1 precorrin-6A reductase [Consotaella salsifontis]
MPASETILVLGGTAEANALVPLIFKNRPGARLILSLAGRTKMPTLSAVETRIGGFGGAEGLSVYLETEHVTRLIDATHPFAATISANAALAANEARVPHIALVRPPWEPMDGDRWRSVASVEEARDSIPTGETVFLALGSQHIAPFAERPDLKLVLRMVEAPRAPFGCDAKIILGRPSPREEDEAEVLRSLGVERLVCRNSGGRISYAKVAAARSLGVPVIIIERPAPPPAPLATSVAEVLAWLEGGV